MPHITLLLAGVLTVALFTMTADGQEPPSPVSPAPSVSPVNPFEQEGQWYRANLHTHTTLSDGSVPVDERLREYREGGYQVLALTDHEKTHDVSAMQSEGFLVISGMETHPKAPDGRAYHFVCLNVPHPLAFAPEMNAADRLAAVQNAGGAYIIAHPYWCGFNVTDLTPFQDAIAVEVYNTVCAGCGRAYSSVQWDDMLCMGWRIPAVAVDDVHGPAPFGGWTMIKARELTLPAIMDALKQGAFYATQGPSFEDVRIVEGKVVVKCSPVTAIRFMSVAATGQVVKSKPGEALTEASYMIPAPATHIRVEIEDAEGRHAWANPVFVK